MDLLLTTVLFLLLVAVPGRTQLPSLDILSLLAFKKGITHDPTGYISASWNEESIDFNGCPSSWNGIVCSGGSVAGVVLDNLDLSGNADLSVFANLTMLLKLSMSGNNLSGILPGNVAGFTKLKHLDVSDNSFSGELPEDIGKLVSLQNLTLAVNTFNGSIPASLLNLKNLVNLNLSRNAFTGDIPTGLEEMGQLESIDLSGNQLDGGVHWEFLTQSSVVHVDLSGNLLTSAGPKEMKFLSEVSETVRYLNLSRNRLTGQLIDAPEISTFGSLKVLDLSCNQLTGELPRFDYVYDLEVLRLGDNGFSGAVPNMLLKGDSLVLSELDLSSNNLSGHIGFISSTTLRTVNLSSNAISGGLPLLTGSCITLDLSRNQFTGNLSVIAKWENDIEYIDLSQNQLTGPVPEVTSEFLQLSHLNLSHNLLTSTLPQVFVQYQKLTVLDLSFNQFGGPIATDWLTSPTLQELYLQNNILEGSIVLLPLTKKSSLQILNLSRNRINGSFPTDLGPLTGLQMLDVSENNFSGVLPQALTKLTALTLLDISLNNFTGPLPSTMSDTLVMFNASYNDLSGVVPDYLREFPSSSFYPGNSRLQFPNSPSGSENAPSGGSSHKPSTAFVKAAIIAACIVALASLFLLAIFVHYKKISQRSRSDKVTDRNVQKKPLSGTAGVRGRDSSGALVVNADELICPLKGLPSEMISQEEKMAVMSSYSPSKNSRFSWSPDCSQDFGRLDVRTPDRLVGDLYFLDETITLTPEELSRAAAEILGRSSRGTSYKATLDNGAFLTVKWLREGVAKQKKEFAKEAKKFTNIRHPNVVGLRGYYWGPTQHEKLILSDYVSPGSLASFLYDRPGRQGPPLTWAQRLKIAVDVARGLNYLHFDRAFPHGNLKATNILLDGLDLNARVSDYCLHRLMTQSGATEQILDSGVLGYRAPELTASKKPIPSFKSDVYAFGILLLELLSGRCAGDVVSVEEGGVDLTEWVRMNVAEGGGDDCFDVEIAQDISNPVAAKGMKEMLGIALRCIRPVSERPGIKSVYEDLSSI